MKQLTPPLQDFVNFAGLTDMVTDELRRRILVGELPPGAKLRQRDLADQLGVSREPIKHAVAALSLEGLIVKPPRRSAIVAPLERKSVQDVYEVRVGLDAIVTRAVCRLEQPAREALLDELAQITLKQQEITEAANHSDLVDLDRQFHLAIYEAARNQIAITTFRSAWSVIGRAIGLLVSSHYHGNSWEEHAVLMDLIRKGDAVKAGELAEIHCQRAADWLLDDDHKIFSTFEIEDS